MRIPVSSPVPAACLRSLGLISLSLALFAACVPTGENYPAPRATRGVLDLRSYDFGAGGVVELNGEWEFHWQRLLTPADFAAGTVAPHYEQVPELWPAYRVGSVAAGLAGDQPGRPAVVPEATYRPGHGTATYRLRVLLAPGAPPLALKLFDAVSAYRIYAGEQELGGSGVVGDSAETTEPGYRTRTVRLPERSVAETPEGPNHRTLDLTIQVSNFHQRHGGIWAAISLGEHDAIRELRERRYGFELFLLGALVIMGIYHVGLYVLRVNDRSTLYFGIFCFFISLRVAVTGERFLHGFDVLPWWLLLKFEYAAIYVSVPLFVMFVQSLYSEESGSIFVRIAQVLSAICTLIVIVAPVNVFAITFDYFQALLLATVVWSLWIFIRAIRNRREGAVIAAVCSVLFALTVINDVLYNQQYIQSVQMVGWGLFIFIFFQSFILSVRFSRAFSTIEAMSENLKRFNAAYSRFVPTEFLKFLRKDSILDIRLGDQIQAEMTILFSDIRSFSEISETMTPKENFDFLNGYLNLIGPLIREHGGFIDKYLGDGVMALFPENPEDAIRAALSMHQAIVAYNQEREEQGRRAVRVGVGVHTGVLMLGTVGEEERMDGTVISDAVNLASRLEGLSKLYGASLIVSSDTLYKLEDLGRYGYRFVGKIRVKGKTVAVPVFEVFDSDAERDRELKLATRERFEEAVFLYHDLQFDQAQQRFEEILEEHPEDGAARLFIKRIAKLRKRGLKAA